jgi:hypothetical protein
MNSLDSSIIINQLPTLELSIQSFVATADCLDAISSQTSSSAESQRSTANSQLTLSTEFFFINTLHGPNRKHRSQNFFYCCLRICCRGNMFTEPLPSNGRLLLLHYSAFRRNVTVLSCCNFNKAVLSLSITKWTQ